METPSRARIARIARIKTLLNQWRNQQTEDQARREIERDLDTRNKIVYFGELINREGN